MRNVVAGARMSAPVMSWVHESTAKNPEGGLKFDCHDIRHVANARAHKLASSALAFLRAGTFSYFLAN